MVMNMLLSCTLSLKAYSEAAASSCYDDGGKCPTDIRKPEINEHGLICGMV